MPSHQVPSLRVYGISSNGNQYSSKDGSSESERSCPRLPRSVNRHRQRISEIRASSGTFSTRFGSVKLHSFLQAVRMVSSSDLRKNQERSRAKRYRFLGWKSTVCPHDGPNGVTLRVQRRCDRNCLGGLKIARGRDFGIQTCLLQCHGSSPRIANRSFV